MAIYKCSAAKELSQGLTGTIQLVVRAGLDLGISRFQVLHPNHSAMLPPAHARHDEFIDIRTVMKKLLCSFVFQCNPYGYVEELVENMQVQ